MTRPRTGSTRVMDRVFGGFFRGFNRVFQSRLRELRQRRRPHPGRKSRSRCWSMAVCCCATYFAVPAGAARLRAGAGQAVSGRLRATARRRHAGPHRSSDPPDVRHRAQRARRARTPSPSPACPSTASSTAPPPASSFVDAEAVRRSAASTICPAWPSRSSCRPNSPASRTPSSPSSRRRRCRAWAPSAASSCRSRTAPTWATTRSTQVMKQIADEGRTRRRSWQACSPASPVNVPQLFADLDRTKAQQLGVRCAERVRHHADLSGLALCQRLQPVRPHLSGDRAGRHAVPLAARRHSAAARSAMPTARWCRWARW